MSWEGFGSKKPPGGGPTRGVEDRLPVDAVIHHPRLAGLPRSQRERVRMNRFAKDLARWLVGRPREELGALARVVTVVARKELSDARRLAKDRPLLAVEAAARTVEVLWPLLRGPEEPDEDEEPGDGDGDGGEGSGEGEAGEEGEEGLSMSGAGGGGSADEEDSEEDDEEQEGAAGAGSGEGDAEDQDADGDDGEGSEEGEEGEEQDSEDSEEGEDASEDDGDGESEDGESDGEGLDPLDVLEALAEMGHVADPELDALAQRLRETMGDGEGEETVDIASAAADLMEGAGAAASEGALETDRVARHLERFLPGIGWSQAPGALEVTLLEQLDGLVTLLSKLDDLQELADALGRMEEPTKERGLIQGGREEVVGVHLGGEVSTALPSELALLADETTEDLFYQRYIEHRLISLELSGAGDQGSAAGDKKGPVIACIDTSGSMEGPPELAAKALVLAVCRRVLPRNRTVHLILFGGPGQRTELRLRRGRGGLEALLEFLLASFHSGTDFDGPLLRAMDLLEEKELLRADVLVVTDGLCRASREVIERVLEVREKVGARVWSVVLGRADTRGVEPFSHEVYALDPRGAAEASGLLQGLHDRRRRPWR